jgi:phosphohistidine phosphatase
VYFLYGKIKKGIIMALYLVQHGKSKPKDEDPERSLSKVGMADTLKMAKIAKEHDIYVSSIRHSGKKRAEQTVEIFAKTLKPQGGTDKMLGLNPLDDVKTIAQRLNSDQNLMLVGHLPFMEKLTSFLIVKDEDITIFKFQNSGIVCLDFDTEGETWYIKWTLMPNVD